MDAPVPAPVPPQQPVLLALVGPPPSSAATVHVASNTPEGGWRQRSFRSLEVAATDLAARADRAELYVATAWFAGGRGRIKAATVAKRSICADIDDKAMPGATSAERHAQARALADSVPTATVLVDSGGGFHMHLLLATGERLEDFGDREDGQRHLEGLAIALRLYLESQGRENFGASVELDKTDGVERMWRAPAGWNQKAEDGARVLTADRTLWRPVRLAYPETAEALASVEPADLSFLAPYRQHAEELWEARAGRSKAPCDTRSAKAQVTGLGRSECGSRTAGGVGFSPTILPRPLADAWPMCDGDDSKHEWAIVSALAEAGWHPDTAKAAIRQHREILGDPKGHRKGYVDGTVAKAYAACAPAPPSCEIPAAIPFPLDALPAPLAEYLRAQAMAMGCAVESIAVPYLTALGSAIGNTRSVRLKRGWFESPLLWTAAVSPSGTLKSPALDVATKAHLVHARELRDEYTDEKAGHEAATVIHKKKLAAWRSKKDDYSAAPKPPEKPVLERVLISDTTLEALIPILEENPRGVLLQRDELGGWFKSFNSYRSGQGGDLEQWLTIHRAGGIQVDRKKDREHLSVDHAFVAITGGVQPKILRRLLTPEFFECGLAARFFLSHPETPPKRWRDSGLSDAEVEEQGEIVKRLFSLRFVIGTEGPRPRWLGLTPEAKEVWTAYYDDISAAQARLGEDDPMRAALSKLEGGAARIALILSLAHWAYSGDTVEPDDITLVDMRGGIAFARYFARQAERIYASFTETDEQRCQQGLVDWIKKRGGLVRLRDLVRGPATYRDDQKRAEKDLDRLARCGRVWRRWLAAPRTGGHSTVEYELRSDGDCRTRSAGAQEIAGLEGRVSHGVADDGTSTPRNGVATPGILVEEEPAPAASDALGTAGERGAQPCDTQCSLGLTTTMRPPRPTLQPSTAVRAESATAAVGTVGEEGLRGWGEPPAGACDDCRGTDFWVRRSDGVDLCRACHPPELGEEAVL